MRGFFRKVVGQAKKGGESLKENIESRLEKVDKEKIINQTKEKAKEGLSELRNLSDKMMNQSSKGRSRWSIISTNLKVFREAYRKGKEELEAQNSKKKIGADHHRQATKHNQKVKESNQQTKQTGTKPLESSKPDANSTTNANQTQSAEKGTRRWWSPNIFPYFAALWSRLPSFPKPKMPTLPKLAMPSIKIPSLKMPSFKMPNFTPEIIQRAKGFFSKLAKWLLLCLFFYGMGYALGTSIPRQFARYFQSRYRQGKEEPQGSTIYSPKRKDAETQTDEFTTYY